MSVSRSLALVIVIAAVAASSGRSADSEPAQPSQPVVVKVENGRFHWQDAGLGAAAALAGVLLVVGLRLSVRQTNGRRKRT